MRTVVLLLLTMAILASAVACDRDSASDDDGKESNEVTYKEGLCGPDDIPKDVPKYYYAENLAELKEIYYNEYKKKCDFKCLVPDIEEAEGVSDLYLHDNPRLTLSPIWNESFPVKEHCIALNYAFELKNQNTEKTYVFGDCKLKICYFDADNVDLSDLKVETDRNLIYIKYDNYTVIECIYGNNIKLNDGTRIDDKNFEGRDILIDLILKNLEYWR